MSSEMSAAAQEHHPKSYWRLFKRVAKRFTKKALGWVLIAVGFVLIAIGLAAVIVPGHYVLVVLGLILVLRNAFWARRHFIHLKRRHPNWIMPIRKLLRRNPPLASIFWQQVLKIERFILRSKVGLGSWRRRTFRRTRATA